MFKLTFCSTLTAANANLSNLSIQQFGPITGLITKWTADIHSPQGIDPNVNKHPTTTAHTLHYKNIRIAKLYLVYLVPTFALLNVMYISACRRCWWGLGLSFILFTSLLVLFSFFGTRVYRCSNILCVLQTYNLSEILYQRVMCSLYLQPGFSSGEKKGNKSKTHVLKIKDVCHFTQTHSCISCMNIWCYPCVLFWTRDTGGMTALTCTLS